MPRSTRSRIALTIQTVFFSSVIAVVSIGPITALSAAELSRISYDVPAGSLEDALNTFAKQSGMTLSFDPVLVKGKTAPAIKGPATKDEVLNRLLKGSGLTPETKDGVIVIKPVPVSAQTDTLPEVAVTDKKEKGVSQALTEPYAGGQLAKGGNLGLLGNRDVFETPFNVTYFTNQSIKNQQAVRVEDVVKGDPSVRVANSTTTFYQDFMIRGYRVTGNASLVNGLPGMFPQYGPLMTQGLERVEVFKGANAMLAGVAGGLSIGGTINLVTKRATDTPITSITTSYISDSQFGASIDLGRRFGTDNQFGIRFNGYKAGGETAVDNERDNLENLVLALDYRGERTRAFVDINKYYQHNRASVIGIALNPGVEVPRNIDSSSNVQQPFSFSNTDTKNIQLRGEYDITDNLMAYSTFGASYIEYKQILPFALLKNAAGDIDEIFQHGSGKEYYRTYNMGLIGKAITGPIEHQFALTHLRNWSDSYGQYYFDPGVDTQATVASNLYNPVRGIAKQNLAFVSYSDLPKTFRNIQTSTAIADTLSIFDRRLQVTLGVRRQNLETEGQYDETAYTPSTAAMFKLTNEVSIYGNYIESLEGGPTAPSTANNRNQVYPPTKDKQKEVGFKVDLGKLGFTTSIFQIDRPAGITDPTTNIFSLNGNQRNRGLEFNIFGEPVEGIRLNGGFAVTQAKLEKTENGTFDGQNATGIAKNNVVLNGEWDVSAVPGLTLTGFIQRSGDVFINRENTRHIDAFTDTTIGARYAMKVNSHPLTLRGSITNVFDKDYWIADVYGSFYQSLPRTVRLSATMDF